jgi:rod shape-determining protein MreC
VVGEIGGSNVLGVVSGTGNKDVVEMRYVSGIADVQVGQTVYTTGQDGIYPAGLKVGEIAEIKEAGSATVAKQILIRPSGRIDSMQEVGVLIYEPPARGEFEQKLPNALPKEKNK